MTYGSILQIKIFLFFLISAFLNGWNFGKKTQWRFSWIWALVLMSQISAHKSQQDSLGAAQQPEGSTPVFFLKHRSRGWTSRILTCMVSRSPWHCISVPGMEYWGNPQDLIGQVCWLCVNRERMGRGKYTQHRSMQMVVGQNKSQTPRQWNVKSCVSPKVTRSHQQSNHMQRDRSGCSL